VVRLNGRPCPSRSPVHASAPIFRYLFPHAYWSHLPSDFASRSVASTLTNTSRFSTRYTLQSEYRSQHETNQPWRIWMESSRILPRWARHRALPRTSAGAAIRCIAHVRICTRARRTWLTNCSTQTDSMVPGVGRVISTARTVSSPMLDPLVMHRHGSSSNRYQFSGIITLIQ
jgi:hypothetical protein